LPVSSSVSDQNRYVELAKKNEVAIKKRKAIAVSYDDSDNDRLHVERLLCVADWRSWLSSFCETVVYLTDWHQFKLAWNAEGTGVNLYSRHLAKYEKNRRWTAPPLMMIEKKKVDDMKATNTFNSDPYVIPPTPYSLTKIMDTVQYYLDHGYMTAEQYSHWTAYNNKWSAENMAIDNCSTCLQLLSSLSECRKLEPRKLKSGDSESEAAAALRKNYVTATYNARKSVRDHYKTHDQSSDTSIWSSSLITSMKYDDVDLPIPQPVGGSTRANRRYTATGEREDPNHSKLNAH
jgi:hypothetical protein